MPGFTLHLDFHGLCMFAAVPSSADDDTTGVMHVLFPQAEMPMGGDMTGHSMPDMRHIAALYFDCGYLNPDPTTRAIAGFPAQVPLLGQILELPGSSAKLKMCPDVLGLRSATNNVPVDATLFGTQGLGRIVARMTFGAGKNSAVDPGYCWNWLGTVRRLAYIIRWTIDYPLDSLEFTCGSLDGAAVAGPPKLYPINNAAGQPEMHLSVYHVPPGDLPVKPPAIPQAVPVGAPPAHFAAFFQLYPPGTQPTLPTFDSEDGCGDSGCDLATGYGSSPYNCMGVGDP